MDEKVNQIEDPVSLQEDVVAVVLEETANETIELVANVEAESVPNAPADTVENMYTTKDVAERLGVTIARVQQYIKSDRLPHKKIGRDWIIPLTAEELDIFVDTIKTNRKRYGMGRPRRKKLKKAG